MTGNEMLSTLSLRLEDPSSTAFTAAARLDALNIAQKEVVNIIHNGYLTELQVISVHVDHVTNGFTTNKLAVGDDASLTFAAASIAPIRNGIIAIKVYNLTGGSGSYAKNSLGFANMIEPRDIKRKDVGTTLAIISQRSTWSCISLFFSMSCFISMSSFIIHYL